MNDRKELIKEKALAIVDIVKNNALFITSTLARDDITISEKLEFIEFNSDLCKTQIDMIKTQPLKIEPFETGGIIGDSNDKIIPDSLAKKFLDKLNNE